MATSTATVEAQLEACVHEISVMEFCVKRDGLMQHVNRIY